MTLSISQWHQRYQQQARWTLALRKHVYAKVRVEQANNILDVGCGTGVLEYELNLFSPSRVFGVDIDIEPIQIARKSAFNSTYMVGDCIQLPFQNGEFDITLCHFLLLWVKDTFRAIAEMVRVTHPGGFVLALAEPDYGGRIDYPTELSQVGDWQKDALIQQGANPLIGRELRSIFSRVGLINTEVGVLGGQWGNNNTESDVELEWEVIRSDLSQNDEYLMHAEQLKKLDTTSRAEQHRILFVPTFYAFGMVPN
jgi:ubiquinone/menaquinone biosynthesis C-methylase UbiE